MRKSTLYLFFMTICISIFLFLFMVHPHLNAKYYGEARKQKGQLVKELGLTDLCLFTEARYTRHLSQADLFSAFQDSPMAFEHFPSGSMTLPPVTIHRRDR